MIFSTGKAAKHYGELLGQYEYHEDKGYYVQTSTETVAVYLYRDEYDEWWVNHTPGQNAGWLHNPRSSQTPPSSGWQYGDPTTDSFKDDQTLTVTPGPLTLPRQFTVTARGAAAEVCPECQGVFTKTERWWHGKPEFVNTKGYFLSHGVNDDGWVIWTKSESNQYSLRGSRGRYSPASEKSWRYWTGSEDKPASVTVTGSN